MQQPPSEKEFLAELERLKALNITDEKLSELSIERLRQFSDDRQAYFDAHFPKAKALTQHGSACLFVAVIATIFAGNSLVTAIQGRHSTILPALYLLLAGVALCASAALSIRGILNLIRLHRDMSNR